MKLDLNKINHHEAKIILDMMGFEWRQLSQTWYNEEFHETLLPKDAFNDYPIIDFHDIEGEMATVINEFFSEII
jgi:hypothetical protein